MNVHSGKNKTKVLFRTAATVTATEGQTVTTTTTVAAAGAASTTTAAATTTTTKKATPTSSAFTTKRHSSIKKLKMSVLQKTDNTINSTPATPNSTVLASPGTPVLQQQQQQQQHHYHHNNNNNNNNHSGSSNHNNSVAPPAPPITPGNLVHTSGHKNSLKGTKLARRARSFKDDLVEKFSLMRTTNNTLGRSNSPHSPRNKHASAKPPPSADEVAKSSQTLETHVKDISNSLKHFRDVILKKKLEMLPGNGTVILETIASMYSVIQSYTLNEQSTVLLSATQQVYQSLGKLIKLCDEVMLSEESGECASLSHANVHEVINLLDDAVRNLVSLAQQKLKEKDECTFRYAGSLASGIAADVAAITAAGGGGGGNNLATAAAGTSSTAGTVGNAAGAQYNHHLMRPPVEVAGQRTSLPDITLTPKERDILEKTKSNPIRGSHSTESILRDTSPPPKPPLPHRASNPPPLPPKRRSQPTPQQQQLQQQQQLPHHLQQQYPTSITTTHSSMHSNNISMNSDLDCSSDFSLINYGVDHLSVRSRSPDENSSQCSLDSALNHSREEEELKQHIRPESRLNDNLILEDDVDKMLAITATATENDTKTITTTTISNANMNNVNDIEEDAAAVVAAATAIVMLNIDNGVDDDDDDDDAAAASIIISEEDCCDDVNVATTATTTMPLSHDVVICESSHRNCDESGAGASASNENYIHNSNDGDGDSGSGNGGDVDSTEMRQVPGSTMMMMSTTTMTTTNNNRHSNESGFVSMKSYRASTQSVSKRSSDYSVQSSTKSSSSNSELAFGISQDSTTTTTGGTLVNSSSDFHQQQQQHQQQFSATTTTTTMQQQQQQQQQIIMTSTATTTMSSSSSSTRQVFTSSSSSLGLTTGGGGGGGGGSSDVSETHNSTELLLNHLQQQLQQKSNEDIMQLGGTIQPPPALPPKILRSGSIGSRERQHSQCDNFDELDDNCELPELRHPPARQLQNSLQQQQVHHQQQHQIYHWQSKHQSLIEPRSNLNLAGSCTAISSSGSSGRHLDEPPPLPMKKKHILAYMEICSASTQHRHTMHDCNITRNITHSQTMNIVPLSKDLTPPEEHETPPALPPKNYKPRKTMPPTIITTPPPSPKPTGTATTTHLSAADIYSGSSGCGYIGGGGGGISDTVNVGNNRHARVFSNATTTGSETAMQTVCEEFCSEDDDGTAGALIVAAAPPANDNNDQSHFRHSHNLPNELVSGSGHGGSGIGSDNTSKSPQSLRSNVTTSTPDLGNEEDEGIDVVLENHHHQMPNMLEEIDITPYLILKKEGEDGPEVKGGYIDALIVHACRVQKVADNAFSEAFITTFRTFIPPIDVIEKLTHRYTVFFCQMNDQKQKAAKETFSLLVRVVNDLTSTDLTSQLLTLLVEFVYQLVCSGQLYLAKLLRIKFVEKVTLFREPKVPNYQNKMHETTTNQPSLLDLKSVEIAEQMTLLDAELFQKIEIPEVLLFAKEQCEEKSPNLNKFTEHFNKMSYWARSKILTLSDTKEREKHVIKFIKIMKHLRKMNNYNSYLALLSALDSAPIRRLEWHKTITEGLKEYCTLIDSSSSFRVYRQALAETNPPCIPYIGLVLQDLTFVHVGNQDYLSKGVINFSKRWQQYNIIVNMKRFKKCLYPYRRNERIIQFFENFENFLGEEEMWQISESIKPRGKRPANNY